MPEVGALGGGRRGSRTPKSGGRFEELPPGGRSEETCTGDGARHGVGSAARPGYLCSAAGFGSVILH